MTTSVAEQAVFAALALVLGYALGLVFDALQAPRRRCRRLARAGLDVLFALIVFTGLFLLGLRSPAGRAGLDSVFLAALGALLYGVTLSPLAAPLFRRAVDKYVSFVHLLKRPLSNCEKKFKNFWKMRKKLFPNLIGISLLLLYQLLLKVDSSLVHHLCCLI